MIDLTPLDVRNKRGDFRRALRGYDPEEVDVFLELVAERLEALVRENLALGERAEVLAEQVDSQSGRERAVHEALVTAQELREDIRGQAQREADLLRSTAEKEAERIVAAAEKEARRSLAATDRELALRREIMEDLDRKRTRFLRAFRTLLERELDTVEVEEGRGALDDRSVDLALGGAKTGEPVGITEVTAESNDAPATDAPVSLFDVAVEPPTKELPVTEEILVGVDDLAPDSPPVGTDAFDPGAVPSSDVEPPVPTFEELMDESEGREPPGLEDDGRGRG